LGRALYIRPGTEFLELLGDRAAGEIGLASELYDTLFSDSPRSGTRHGGMPKDRAG
jgi:hypothetical protein